MAGRKIRNEREARECLDAAASSGIERAAWARRQGIDPRSLNAWRINLDRRERDEPGALRIVELVPTATSHTQRAPIRVRCGSFNIEVDAEFDEDLLARVLTVVASC